MKICTIVGARPQFIKTAVVSRALKTRDDIDEVIIHTGQHYDANMSNVFFNELDIPSPDYNLGIGGGTHGQNTGRMIEQIESVLLQEKPEWVLVYGDTDSTLSASIAASKLHIPIAHVEAGLRSFNRLMPEEINRILTDHVSHLLFTPSILASEQLIKEGISNTKIKYVGDVMYDAALFYKHKAKKLDHVNLKDNFILCTIHRAENTSCPAGLKSIIQALQEIALQTQIILPIHPRTKKYIDKLGLNVDNVVMIDPIGYLEMIFLLSNAQAVITDSGGLQKEAYFFKKPCITLREQTEWTELVECGANTLVTIKQEKIVSAVNLMLDKKINFDSLLYGDGRAAEKIIGSFL
ncbi:MAG: UDP-N-acetylglucosamine 2-epimerase (non-hydrolyzing) [Legionella sp.]|nr:MAG: UDP-N-acetylglucosamine 2-epimerase (non-hydrolyzing) [Legionella sp.]PJD97391.1 MAG: UDP-N-acetylglucosamine 2-epimerase (non-hydrolyzing) [Legionella sp.]